MSRTIPTAPVVLASSLGGDVVVCDGIVYLLTECCSASGKGSSNSPTGICCRACYRPVDSRFGWAALVTDADVVDSLAGVLLEAWAGRRDEANLSVARQAAATMLADVTA